MSILTFCAVSREELPSAPLEALAAARRLGDQLGGGEVQTLLVGSDVADHATALIQRGADSVSVVDDPRLDTLQEELLLGAAEGAVVQLSPDVIIFPHDERSGGNVAPRLAHRLKTGIVTDCTGFEVEDGSIRWLRPVYGAKAMAYIRASGPVQLATMRALSFEPLPADASRQGTVQDLDVDLGAISPQVPIVDFIVREEAFEGPSLDRADIVVSGGRGMGDEQGFQNLKDLARILNAAVGGSRPAADTGWVPHSHLVGQTGKIVAPSLYVAVGISGAPQHMSGAGSSKTIVAINKDEDAPIFRAAHVGVIDEWENVIPALIEELKEK
ncbi:MAG: electron transfer flavoprotein subunit alpha/FixB family protein [Anaerolineae bacterium]|jgi:electron transfer flavoprotein alpha subunit